MFDVRTYKHIKRDLSTHTFTILLTIEFQRKKHCLMIFKGA